MNAVKHNFKKPLLIVSALSAALLSGCATTPTGSITGDSEAQQALTQSINDVNQTTAMFRTAPTPYVGFPTPAPAAHPVVPAFHSLDTVVSVQWTGDAHTLVAGLANRIRWTYINKAKDAKGKDIPMPVMVNLREVSIAKVISEVSAQIPAGHKIVAGNGKITLE